MYALSRPTTHIRAACRTSVQRLCTLHIHLKHRQTLQKTQKLTILPRHEQESPSTELGGQYDDDDDGNDVPQVDAAHTLCDCIESTSHRHALLQRLAQSTAGAHIARSALNRFSSPRARYSGLRCFLAGDKRAPPRGCQGRLEHGTDSHGPAAIHRMSLMSVHTYLCLSRHRRARSSCRAPLLYHIRHPDTHDCQARPGARLLALIFSKMVRAQVSSLKGVS